MHSRLIFQWADWVNKTQVKNNVVWRLITACFLIGPPFQADNHGEAANAPVIESSIFTLNDGKTIEGSGGFFKVFKKWAKKNGYNNFSTVDTPFYVAGTSDIPVLMLDYGSYQELGQGWDKSNKVHAVFTKMKARFVNWKTFMEML